MDANGEFAIGMIAAMVLAAGVIWRFETHIAGVEVCLGERISAVDARVLTLRHVWESEFPHSQIGCLASRACWKVTLPTPASRKSSAPHAKAHFFYKPKVLHWDEKKHSL